MWYSKFQLKRKNKPIMIKNNKINIFFLSNIYEYIFFKKSSYSYSFTK
jgi:hypothetical protein